jgi:hypothetical protein
MDNIDIGMRLALFFYKSQTVYSWKCYMAVFISLLVSSVELRNARINHSSPGNLTILQITFDI